MDIKKIILEEVNDFDWVKEIEPPTLHVGAFMMINDNSVFDEDNPSWTPGDYILLKITGIDGDELHYRTYDTNVNGENGHDVTDVDWAEHLVITGYWQPWDIDNDKPLVRID